MLEHAEIELVIGILVSTFSVKLLLTRCSPEFWQNMHILAFSSKEKSLQIVDLQAFGVFCY